MTEGGFAFQLAQDLDPEDLRVVLGVFQQDVARLTAVLDVSAAAGDVASFQRACHSIAGAAGAVGALALEQASRLAMTQPDMVPAQLPGLHAGIAAWSAQALDETAAFLAALPAG